MSETVRTSNCVPMLKLGRAGALDRPVVNSASAEVWFDNESVFALRYDFEIIDELIRERHSNRSN